MAKTTKAGATPRLRFPEFAGQTLSEVQLKDVTAECATRNGALLPVTSVMGVSNAQGIIPMKERLVANDIARYKIVRKEWFAYNPMRLNIGSIARWQGEGDILVSPDYVVFKCINNADSGLNAAYLDQFRQTNTWSDFVTDGGDGSVRVRIYYKDIARLHLVLPRVQEQKKVADCLASLDDVITAQARKVEALKAHKRGLMQQLFPREGETVPQLRFPEYRDAPAWRTKTLGEAATFYNGRAYAKEELLEAGEYQVLRVGNFFTSDKWYYSNLELEPSKYCDDGDLLYAWSASFGPRIWRGGKTIYHYHIWKVAEKKGVRRNFLLAVLGLETERIRARSANGIGMFHITKGTIESWPSLFPEEEEQIKIAEYVATIDKTLEVESEKVDELNVHKAGLMQQFFPTPDASE